MTMATDERNGLSRVNSFSMGFGSILSQRGLVRGLAR